MNGVWAAFLFVWLIFFSVWASCSGMSKRPALHRALDSMKDWTGYPMSSPNTSEAVRGEMVRMNQWKG